MLSFPYVSYTTYVRIPPPLPIQKIWQKEDEWGFTSDRPSLLHAKLLFYAKTDIRLESSHCHEPKAGKHEALEGQSPCREKRGKIYKCIMSPPVSAYLGKMSHQIFERVIYIVKNPIHQPCLGQCDPRKNFGRFARFLLNWSCMKREMQMK